MLGVLSRQPRGAKKRTTVPPQENTTEIGIFTRREVRRTPDRQAFALHTYIEHQQNPNSHPLALHGLRNLEILMAGPRSIGLVMCDRGSV